MTNIRYADLVWFIFSLHCPLFCLVTYYWLYWLHIKRPYSFGVLAPTGVLLRQNWTTSRSNVSLKVFRCNCYFYNLHYPTKQGDAAIKFATLIISTCSVSNRTNGHHYHQHQYQQGYSVGISLITESEFGDFLRSSWQTI